MFNFRKIASVLASTVMLGSTVALAAAAYPAPFVSGGAADVAVVWGSNAALSDLVAVTDITNSLQVKLAQQTATSGSSTGASASGGDSVNLATSARKLYYGDAINSARTSISSSDLPKVLGDGKVLDLKGVEYGYTQSIKPMAAIVSSYGTSGGDLSDPALILQVGTDATAPLYNYTLSFTKNLNVSDDTNVQGQKIKILGVDYVIGASSTNTTLYLYGAGQTVTLAGAESKTVSIAGKDHIVELVGATGTTTAKITVDGVSKTVVKGSSYSFTGDVTVYAKDVTYQAYAGGVQSVELIIGANTLKLVNGQSVKQGADALTVKGTSSLVTASDIGTISGFTIAVALPTSQKDHIGIGGSFTDPVFGGLKVQFAGAVPDLNDSARAKIVVDTDNNQFARVKFTSAQSGVEKQFNYVYDNNTASTAVQPLLAQKQLASNKGYIHVLEGEPAQVGDWIVINAGDSGGILQVDSIDLTAGDATGTVTFSNALTGANIDAITLTNSTQAATGAVYSFSKTGLGLLGGTGYTVTGNATQVNISWNSGTRALFPRIKLKDGGWIALLTQTTLGNATGNAVAGLAGENVIFPDGLTTLATSGVLVNTTAARNNTVNGLVWNSYNNVTANNTVYAVSNPASTLCNFNATFGPAILYIEPKKWNDASFGNFICIPLTTTGTTELAIGTPYFNGTNSGFTTLNSDTYKSAAVDQFGAFVTNEQRTNENGVITIMTPSSQMYLDVLFTSDMATVSAGTVSSGTVKELGSVSVKDSDAAAVSGKNLIVVGGSCVNSVAATLLGSTSALCGADFSTSTGVSAGQFLIQTFARDGGKVATLVAGYGADDTANAGKYLTTQTVDTSVAAKYIGTSATVATLQTVSA